MYIDSQDNLHLDTLQLTDRQRIRLQLVSSKTNDEHSLDAAEARLREWRPRPSSSSAHVVMALGICLSLGTAITMCVTLNERYSLGRWWAAPCVRTRDQRLYSNTQKHVPAQ